MQRMVDFGPRLTGYPATTSSAWVEDEMRAAGLEIAPYDIYDYDCYRTGDVQPRDPRRRRGRTGRRRDVLRPIGRHPSRRGDRSARRRRRVSRRPTSSRRSSIRTPPPPPCASGSPSVPDGTYRDAILLVELSTPGELNAGVFTALSTYLQWDGHTTRTTGPARLLAGLDGTVARPRRPRSARGASGVVFTTRASKEMLRGNNSLHIARPQPLPALVVDRDTGADAARRRRAPPDGRGCGSTSRSSRCSSGSSPPILPGASDECIIVNTHTDGQNAFEENGAVAAVAMARHFASLPDASGCNARSVFAFYPGHMSGRVGIEDPRGWILKHPELIERAVGAVSIEHLGATEWVDDEHGLPTHRRERDLRHLDDPGRRCSNRSRCRRSSNPGLQRHALLKPPVQITPGRAFHWLGVPHVSGIAGPTYLLNVTDNGEMDKFDADARRPPDRLLRRRRATPRHAPTEPPSPGRPDARPRRRRRGRPRRPRLEQTRHQPLTPTHRRQALTPRR